MALSKRDRQDIECPFRSSSGRHVSCTKEGGVCSLRLYSRDSASGTVNPHSREGGELRVTCPYRFDEGGDVDRWIGQTVLGTADLVGVGEVGFLERESA